MWLKKVKNTDHTQTYTESNSIYYKGAKTALNWYIKALAKGVYLTLNLIDHVKLNVYTGTGNDQSRSYENEAPKWRLPSSSI